MKPNTSSPRSSFLRQTPFLFSGIFLIMLLASAASAQQNGVWTNDASSVWSAGNNWLNGVVASGVGATADFTLDNSNFDTVTLDSSRSIGTLLFGNNATVQTNQWILNASGGSVLTLAGGTPSIAVSNGVSTNTAVLSLPIAGSAGLIKVGSGKLVLGGPNTYSGGTVVSGGVVQLANNSSATGPVLYLSFNNVGGNVVTNGGSGGAAMNGVIVGTGVSVTPGAGPNGNAALTVGSGAVNAGYVLVNSAVVPFNVFSTNNWTLAMWIKTSTAGATYAYQGDGGFANANTTFHLNGGTNDQAGPYAGGVRFGQGWQTGSTALTDGNWHFVTMTCANGVKTNYVDGNFDPWTVSGATMFNGWNGAGSGGQFWVGGSANIADNDVRMNGQIAEVYVYNRALSQVDIQGLTNSTGPSWTPALPTASSVSVAASAKLDLNGVSPALSGLSGLGFVDTSSSAGSNQLVINNSVDALFGGIVTNSSGTLSLHKAGTGALALTNANTYTGNTILDGGTLCINNASAIGTAGTLLINGGTIDNTNGAAVTVINNKASQWAGDFTFNGTTNLSFGTGGVTLTGPGTNRTITLNANSLQTGNINLPGTVTPFLMSLTLNGNGTLLTSSGSGNSTITGDLIMGAGATLANSQDFHCLGLKGAGTVQLNGNVNKWFFVNNTNGTSIFSGTIQDGAAVPVTSRGLGFNKSGTGTQILNGNVTLNDTVTVNVGKLFLTGSGVGITNPAGQGGGPVAFIGTTSSNSAVLILSNNAAFMANYLGPNSFTSGFNIANSANTPTAAGSVWMYPGCAFNVARQLTIGGNNNGSGFAGFSQFGGTTTIGGFIACGGTTNGGVLNISGGTLFMNNGGNGPADTVGYGNSGNGSYGVQNIYGNAVFAMTGAGNGIWPGEINSGTVNLWGNATLAITNDGISFAHGTVGGFFNGSAFNLDGGTLLANFITSVNASGTFNFNGGILRVNAAGQNGSGIFTPGATSTAFYDYSGGTIIDDGGFAITFTYPINAPTGSGISSIPITSGGSNYIDTPIVLIGGGSGTGAKASPQIDYNAGTVTNIVITCPGTGYNNGDTLTFTIIGGGGSGLALGAPTFALNSPGSLTKMGAGSLTLASGNGFAGTTKVLGGNLTINPSAFSSAPDLLVTNASLTVDVSSGSQVNANSVTLHNSSTLNISLGNLTANPSFPALNATTFSAPGTGLTIAISGLGLRPGTITLIKYTGAALPNLNNFSLTLPPGVAATLVNNTGNDSIDLHITTAPNFLTWEGVAGTAWDVNTTANWRDPLNNEIVYQQYTNGAVVVGDAVTFDDTLTNDFVNPQPTNINLTTTVYSFPVIVNSSLPYSFGGTGSLAGSGYLVESNTGTLAVNTTNSYTGGTFFEGGTLIVTNDSALGAGSGSLNFGGGTLQLQANVTNSRPLIVTASSSLDVPTNLTAQFAGSISGSGALVKTNDGTLILTGANGLSGTLTVNQGLLTTTGTNALAAVPIVGNIFGFNGTLKVAGGVFQDNNNPANPYNTSLTIGNALGGAGNMIVSGGTVTIPKQLTVGPTGYGAYDQSAGNTTIGGFIALGGGSSGAVLNQTGGTINLTNCSATIGYNTTASLGVMNLSGSAVFNTFNNGGAFGGSVWPGEVGNGTLNVSGSAALTITNDGLAFGRGNAASIGTVNLNGGIITTGFITNGPGTGIFNFNGGVLKANAGGVFTKAVGNTTAFFDYNGGAIIDDGGNNITFARAIQAPNGFGVASIPVTPGTGGGYIDTPIVLISGGNGSNATATATVSGGTVTAINITCPGSGYINGDFVNVTFIGGGANPTPPTVGTPTFAPNNASGLTKKGSGTLILTGADTYAGATLVSTGALYVTPLHQVTGAVTVSNSATFGVLVNSGGTASIGNLNLGTSTPSTNFLAFNLANGTNPTAPVLQCGTLTLAGTNLVRLGGIINPGVYPVVKYTGALAGTGGFNTNVVGPQGLVATLSNDVADSILYINVSSSGGIVWKGTNTAAGSVNVWGLNSITNWLVGSTATIYTQSTPPGDTVTFNDAGSGTVLLSNSVSPANVTISNNAVNYALSGTGNMAGTTGLNKLGTGTATINFTNDTYAGNTVISNGTLQVGSTTAVPSGNGAGNVVIASAGALDINGLSPTINGLSGSGVVNNSSGTAATLTFGTASTGDTTWAGSFTNSGGGQITFLKTGTNTVTITGTNFMGGGDPQNQVNGGTMVLTNGGSFIMPSGEFWIAQNASTGAVVVAGGSIICSNNWIVVGRNNAAANGTLTIDSGTVQKGGTAGNVVVGSLNGTGTLIVNGGQLLNTSDLWLGENASAHAYLYLNGGLVQARVLRPNATAPAASIAYFNGGTLQATVSTNSFLQVQSMVMINGLILDDNGFTLAIGAAALQDGDGQGGGLLKTGSGTVYLDAPNSYTGLTAVSNGVLAGVGTISGPVLVNSAGTIGAGDANAVGILSLNSTPLTIQGRAMLRINKTGGTPTSDLITGISTANYGGTLIISNITSDATPLANGDTFTIFSAGASGGNFANIVGSPGPGLAYSFNPANGVLSVVTGVVQPPAPTIRKITLSGTNVIITATNNNGAGGTWALLGTNNLTSPLTNWPVITNGTFDFNGNLALTNGIGTNRGFFILRVP